MEDVYTQRQLQVDWRVTASDYNARKHRIIGMRLADVTPTIAERLLDTVYSAIKIVGSSKFKVDDSIREQVQDDFWEGLHTKLDTEVFTIVKIQRTNPVTYLLEDYRGKFVALSRGAFYLMEKENKVYVK